MLIWFMCPCSPAVQNRAWFSSGDATVRFADGRLHSDGALSLWLQSNHFYIIQLSSKSAAERRAKKETRRDWKKSLHLRLLTFPQVLSSICSPAYSLLERTLEFQRRPSVQMWFVPDDLSVTMLSFAFIEFAQRSSAFLAALCASQCSKENPSCDPKRRFGSERRLPPAASTGTTIGRVNPEPKLSHAFISQSKLNTDWPLFLFLKLFYSFNLSVFQSESYACLIG